MARTHVRASAIIVKKDKILLIHRKKNGEEYWVFPGGGVEDNETPKEAAIREVEEETGLKVLDCKFAFDSANEWDHYDQPFFYCTVSNGTPKLVGEELHRNSEQNWFHPEWVDLRRVKDLPLYPEAAKQKVISMSFSV